MPLSRYPDGEKPANAAPAPAVLLGRPRVPLTTVVQQMTAEAFFRRFASLLARDPPHQDDGPMLAQLAAIGIAPGKPFDTGTLGPDGRKALDEGVELAKRGLGGKDSPFGASGWRYMLSHIGRYGTNYSARGASLVPYVLRHGGK
jgi:hypothetical protein